MRDSRRIDTWFRPVLSIGLLTANLLAPFSWAGPDRALLVSLGRSAASCPVVRVRVVCRVASCSGYRAVVGLSSSGPGAARRWAIPLAFAAVPPAPTGLAFQPQGDRPSPHPTPPLRC